MKIIKMIVFLALLIMSGLFLFEAIFGFGKEDVAKGEENDSEVVYDTTEVIENKVYLGDQDATNEMIFVLDYMCPHCKDWYENIYPTLKEDYIDTGDLKFYVQPQVLLSKQTLFLTEFTQKVETLHPKKYFELIDRLIADHDSEHWGSQEYIQGISENLELIGWEDVELSYDVIRRTRQVTRSLNVDVVPTIYVNGRKVSDSSDLDEIRSLLNETSHSQWKDTGELCKDGAEDC